MRGVTYLRDLVSTTLLLSTDIFVVNLQSTIFNLQSSSNYTWAIFTRYSRRSAWGCSPVLKISVGFIDHNLQSTLTATATTTCVWCNLTAASTLASIRTIYFYFFSLRVFELVGVSECPSFTGHVALHKHTANTWGKSLAVHFPMYLYYTVQYEFIRGGWLYLHRYCNSGGIYFDTDLRVSSVILQATPQQQQ